MLDQSASALPFWKSVRPQPPWGCDSENFLVAEEDHVAVLEQAVVALRIAVATNRGLRARGLLERVRGGHVVGVHVGLERVLEREAVFAQQARVAPDLLGDRIDQHRLVACVVGDEIRESGRCRVEKLFEEHCILCISMGRPAQAAVFSSSVAACAIPVSSSRSRDRRRASS
jgi:hypothetical protein